MTAEQLIHKLNTEFTIHKKWPTTFEVDGDTYSNACNYIFKVMSKMPSIQVNEISVYIGGHDQLMFKNVELIYKAKT